MEILIGRVDLLIVLLSCFFATLHMLAMCVSFVCGGCGCVGGCVGGGGGVCVCVWGVCVCVCVCVSIIVRGSFAISFVTHLSISVSISSADMEIR